jgi:hypothetical protein
LAGPLHPDSNFRFTPSTATQDILWHICEHSATVGFVVKHGARDSRQLNAIAPLLGMQSICAPSLLLGGAGGGGGGGRPARGTCNGTC